MYLIDYHNHSRISGDSEALLLESARAAVAAGISELCVTDHCDPLDGKGLSIPPIDWAAAKAQFHQARAAMEGQPLVMKLGLELGSGQYDSAFTAAVLAEPELDFVIGSLHNSSARQNYIDYYYVNYTSPEQGHIFADDFFSCMEALVGLDCYDVLGHITYLRRYITVRDGQPLDFAPFWDRIGDILKTAAAHGKGIEVNTWCARTLEELRPLLALYKDVGGEVLTVGSDAHTSDCIGMGIPDAYELIKSVGFRYVTTFQHRKPTFIKI